MYIYKMGILNKARVSLIVISLIIISMFCVELVVAENPAIKQNSNLSFSITSNDAVECILTTINSPDSTIFINQNGTKNGQNFNFSINGGNYSSLGNYCHNVVCSDGVDSTSGSECYIITYSGDKITISDSISYFSIFSFFVLIIVALYFLNKNIDYEKWNNNVMNKYEHKNYIKFVLSSIGYNIMKNSFVLFYLLGLPILILITDMSYKMENSTIIQFIPSIFAIYFVGALIVGIYFFGYVQEWIMNSFESIKDAAWGIDGK